MFWLDFTSSALGDAITRVAVLRMLMQSGSPLGGAMASSLLPTIGLPAMIALSAVTIGLPGVAGYQISALRLGDSRSEAPVEAAR